MGLSQRHIGQIVSAASIVSAATLVSRLLGFVRDMGLAWLFGAGLTADAFFVAYRIPSTLRELLGEGALSAAVIPTFTRTATREGRAAAWDLASAVLGTLMLVLAAVSLTGVLLAPWIVRVLAPGFAGVPGKLLLTVQLLRVMFPYIFLVGLAALLMAILNALGHFGAPALSPIVLNICLIGGILWVAPHFSHPALVVGLAVLVGGMGQLLVQVPAAVALGWRLRPRLALADPRVRQIGRLMAPGVAGLAVTQINVVVATLLASYLAQGSVAALTYAFRLVQFPIGVVGVAIATGALPVMAASMARQAVGELKEALQSSLRLAWFLALPAMVGLILFRLPILHLLFERGAFTRPVTLLTAEILMGYTVGLGFYVGNRILTPAFYAMQDTWTPVSSGMVAVGVNILAGIALMGPLGAAGLAVATAMASGGNFVLLFLRLRRRIGRLGGRAMLRGGGKVALACLPMAAWSLLAQQWWDVLAVPGSIPGAGLLFVEMAAAVGIFAASAGALRCEEFKWTLDLLRLRRGATSPGGVFG